MANPYYNASGTPGVGTQGSSAAIRAELDAIELGFDLFPALTANAVVRTNDGGTALSAGPIFASGTWTPVLTCQTVGNLSVAYTTQEGNFIRLGKFSLLNVRIVTSSFTHTTASGDLRITGVPLDCDLSIFAVQFGTAFIGGLTDAARTNLLMYVANFELYFRGASPSADTDTVKITDLPTGGTVSIMASILFHSTQSAG